MPGLSEMISFLLKMRDIFRQDGSLMSACSCLVGADCWAGLSQQPLPSRDVRDFSIASFWIYFRKMGSSHYPLSNKAFVLLEHKVLKGSLQRRLVQAEKMEKCRTMTNNEKKRVTVLTCYQDVVQYVAQVI